MVESSKLFEDLTFVFSCSINYYLLFVYTSCAQLLFSILSSLENIPSVFGIISELNFTKHHRPSNMFSITNALLFGVFLAASVNSRALPENKGDVIIREDDITISKPSAFISTPDIGIRGTRVVNPDAVSFTTCSCNTTAIVSHDINVAILAICGGIAGTIEQCGGSPITTTGSSGTALLTLTAATEGQTIDITKGRWEGCVAAAVGLLQSSASSLLILICRERFVETKGSAVNVLEVLM